MRISFPTKHQIRQSWAYRQLSAFCNNSIVAKIIVSFIIWAVALIPVYLYMLVRWGLGPDGFWQELALIIVCSIVIGWLQGIMLFFAIVLTLMVVGEDL